MPSLDVSDAFDPDFMDPLTCVRTVQTVGSNGRAINTPTSIAFSGVVTNDSGDTLQRGSDAARVAASINVTSPFILNMAGAACDADVVQWDGRAYTVSNVKDYSTYGAGFSIATCTVIGPAG